MSNERGAGPAAWFTCLGLPLTAAESEDLALYMSGIGLAANTPVEQVDSWPAATAILKHPHWDASWWDAEEQARARLFTQVGDSDRVLKRLTEATDQVTEILHGTAAIAAARESIGDPYVIRVASGAALQAVHQAALATQAGEATHAFAYKLSLYRSGHWVLGMVGGSLYLF